MKTELRLRPHAVLAGENVIELWYHGQLIGTVTGADGPGVRVLSKYQIESRPVPSELDRGPRTTPLNIIEVVVPT